MPKINIELSDEQYKKYKEHMSAGLALEFKEETIHGFAINLSSVFGIWEMKIDSQIGNIDLGNVKIDFPQ